MKFLRSKYFLALVGLLVPQSLIFAPNNTDNRKTGVSNCGDKAVDCSVTIHAVGDVLPLNIADLPETSLETISKDATFDIKLPQEEGAVTKYSFTPTSGESRGELIEVAFVNIKQLPGTRDAGKSVIKVYRHFKKDPNPLLWTEIGKIKIQMPSLKGIDTTNTILVRPDGSAVHVNVETGEPTIFLAGKKDLKTVTAANIEKDKADFKSQHPGKLVASAAAVG